METLEFTSNTKRRTGRGDSQTVSVVFCGEPFSVDRPKDAVLYFAQTVVGDSVGEGDRAMAILQFLESTLAPMDRKRFFDRVLDGPRGPDHPGDPVDMAATMELVAGLVELWGDWPVGGDVEALVVEADPQPPTAGPLRVVNLDLDLDVQAWPPKDIVLMLAAASMATGANLGQQAWAISLFLDAALNPADALRVAQRMRRTGDPLDLEDIAEIVEGLLDRWAPGTNRATRRANAKADRAGTTSKPAVRATPARGATNGRAGTAVARRSGSTRGSRTGRA